MGATQDFICPAGKKEAKFMSFHITLTSLVGQREQKPCPRAVTAWCAVSETGIKHREIIINLVSGGVTPRVVKAFKLLHCLLLHSIY